MSTEGTVAAAIMLVLGIAWLSLPILRRRLSASVEDVRRQKERDALTSAYERTLTSLRDVEEDFLTGKLAQADYEVERARWMEQGVTVLQALEKFGGPTLRRSQPPSAAPADPDALLDDAIEQTIANYIKSTR
jgi:hypothetical protein